MGFFSWLFGNRTKVTERNAPLNARPKPTIEIVGTLMCIDAIRWHGHFKKSPNRKWAVSWRDSTHDGSVGGNRMSGEGQYVLVDVSSGTIMTQGYMPRPNGGAVADNGAFSLEDWHFGGTLCGTFHVFSRKAHPCWRKRSQRTSWRVGSQEMGSLHTA